MNNEWDDSEEPMLPQLLDIQETPHLAIIAILEFALATAEVAIATENSFSQGEIEHILQDATPGEVYALAAYNQILALRPLVRIYRSYLDGRVNRFWSERAR